MSAVVIERFFVNILNLSQLTKPKTGTKINPQKANEVLDTNIFELLPTQTTRQDQINNFFSEFDTLIGPRPIFEDSNNDGVVENPINYEQDEQSRISFENQSNAFITRLDEQAEGNSVNQGKTLESMRNRLNTYLGDVDNVITNLEDQRPEYENIASGFLKIRKPNQAIIIKAPNDGLLEFQKINSNGIPSYLDDGFTITMWVRFVGKTQGGTLFNFGNPLEENGFGFRLDTRVNKYNENYYRYISLVVRESDGTLRDNHWGHTGEFGGALGRLSNRSVDNIHERVHTAFPQIPTDNLNEWYFICATYDPTKTEDGIDSNSPYFTNRQYWLNHIEPTDQGPVIVANSDFGARCKVEIISKSELLRARGYKIGDLSITATQTTTTSSDLPELDLEDTPEEEETTTTSA
mgnify:CR=1 FL=1|jgi:hypothetical protein